ncbi:MAG: hypothetical protein IT463_03435, partial [Planctomycetes bacterium]|nr:hypothetical protein [Planctomycetota bacterium]
PAPVTPATLQPHGDEARELRARLGRDPTDAELETLRQKLEAQRAATIGAETERIQALEATMAALKDGDAVSTLRLMQELTPAIRATVRNGEVFSTWFERKTSGPAMDGSAISERNPSVDGATVRFGAGKHVWKVSGLGRADKPFPADVLVVGAGRDETLLSLDEIEATSDVRSLTFQDLTLDCANNYLSDMRSKNGSTIRFERCRIVRFDMGAGGSVMLSSRGGLAFYATDTLITCGYGRSPGSGHLFRVQGVLMVRMERCTVEGPMYGLFSDHGQACYCFVDCSFNNVPKLFEEPAAPEELGAIFERCTFEGLGDAKARQLKLADINPAWKTD